MRPNPLQELLVSFPAPAHSSCSAAIPLQGELVDAVVLPWIQLFGALIYLIEVLIGISLMIGI